MAIPDAPRECGVPTTPPCSAFRLLSSPAHSQRSAIRSGQSHSGLQTQPPSARKQLRNHRLHAIRRPDRCGRVRAVRNSPSDIASCHRVVRRHTCSPVTPTIDASGGTSASRTWGPCRPASPKESIRSELRGPQRARGVPEQHDGRSVASTVYHETSKNVMIWLIGGGVGFILKATPSLFVSSVPSSSVVVAVVSSFTSRRRLRRALF